MKKLIAVLLVALMALMSFGAGFAEESTIKIGAIFPLSWQQL